MKDDKKQVYQPETEIDKPKIEVDVEDEYFHLRDYDRVGGMISVPSENWKVIPHKSK
jgi:hypothetical protein